MQVRITIDRGRVEDLRRRGWTERQMRAWATREAQAFLAARIDDVLWESGALTEGDE